MRPQPHQFLGDIAAIRQDRGLLCQPLGLDPRAAQQIRQLFAQSLLKHAYRARADLFHARHQLTDIAAARAHLLGSGGAFALATAIEQPDRFARRFQHGLGYLFTEFLRIAR